jgi:hypothetical protein
VVGQKWGQIYFLQIRRDYDEAGKDSLIQPVNAPRTLSSRVLQLTPMPQCLQRTTPRHSAYPSGGGEWFRLAAEHWPATGGN